MRTSIFVLLLAVTWTIGAAFMVLADDHEPKKGVADDNCGNICWESTVEKTKGSDTWNYKRVLTNRDKGGKWCAITWTNGDKK